MNNAALGTCLALTAALGAPSSASIIFDFTDSAGLIPDRSDLFDGETSVDILLTDPITAQSSTLTVAAIGGTLNSNASDFGIGNAFIDGTAEAITLTFDSDIELISVDLGGVGSDIADGANLTIDGFSIDLFTGVPGFSGTSDVFTPTSPIAVAAGTSIVFTGSTVTSIFDLEAATFTIVPEPASFGLAGLGALAALGGRRRRA